MIFWCLQNLLFLILMRCVANFLVLIDWHVEDQWTPCLSWNITMCKVNLFFVVTVCTGIFSLLTKFSKVTLRSSSPMNSWLLKLLSPRAFENRSWRVEEKNQQQSIICLTFKKIVPITVHVAFINLTLKSFPLLKEKFWNYFFTAGSGRVKWIAYHCSKPPPFR